MKNNDSEMLWPLWLRLTHWALASIIFVIWIGTFVFYETGWLHRQLGGISVVMIALRWLLTGWSSSSAVRLFWPSSLALVSHFKQLRMRKIEVHTGHNPIGQLASYWLWGCVLMLALSGWLSRTDELWGEDWPLVIHSIASWVLMGSVMLHVSAVWVMSRWSQQSLLKQMLDGRLSRSDKQ